jgi:two-component system chemotaxis sensor kinase CheA
MSDDSLNDAALGTFITESRELLHEIEMRLLDCEHGRADDETLNALFRAAHTIKGSAGLFGLDDIVAFTHVVESVLDRVRTGTLLLTPLLAATLLECRDHIAALIAMLTEGRAKRKGMKFSQD